MNSRYIIWCILIITISRTLIVYSTPDDDPMGSKHVARTVSIKTVLWSDIETFAYFHTSHNRLPNTKLSYLACDLNFRRNVRRLILPSEGNQ